MPTNLSEEYQTILWDWTYPNLKSKRLPKLTNLWLGKFLEWDITERRKLSDARGSSTEIPIYSGVLGDVLDYIEENFDSFWERVEETIPGGVYYLKPRESDDVLIEGSKYLVFNDYVLSGNDHGKLFWGVDDGALFLESTTAAYVRAGIDDSADGGLVYLRAANQVGQLEATLELSSANGGVYAYGDNIHLMSEDSVRLFTYEATGYFSVELFYNAIPGDNFYSIYAVEDKVGILVLDSELPLSSTLEVRGTFGLLNASSASVDTIDYSILGGGSGLSDQEDHMATSKSIKEYADSLIGGGSIPGGTEYGQILYWDQDVTNAWVVSENFIWDEADLQLRLKSQIMFFDGDDCEIYGQQKQSAGTSYNMIIRAPAAYGTERYGGQLHLVGGAGGSGHLTPTGGNVYIYGGNGDAYGNTVLAYDGSLKKGYVAIGKNEPNCMLDVDGEFGLTNSLTVAVDTIETTLTDDDTHIPTSGAVYGAITGGSVIDHGTLLGLSDDDHTQYVLLAGRSGGQTLYGGTGADEHLSLYPSSNVSNNGYVKVQNNLMVEDGIYFHSFPDSYYLKYDSSILKLGGYILTLDAYSVAGGDMATYLTFFNDVIYPGGLSTIDLGSSTIKFKDFYLDGTAYIDNLTLTTGATVDTIEITLTDDDTHLPTSGAVWGHVAGLTGLWTVKASDIYRNSNVGIGDFSLISIDSRLHLYDNSKYLKFSHTGSYGIVNSEDSFKVQLSGTDLITVESSLITVSQDFKIPINKKLYLGDESTNGSWRIYDDGLGHLVVEQRVSGSWVYSGRFTAS